jgi:hypothetical protein
MKKIIVILLAGVILSSFNMAGTNSPETGTVTELNGYKLRYSLVDLHDFNLWVVTSEDAFYNEFEAENETVARPDFSSQMVLAGKVETVNFTYRVRFQKIVAEGNTLNVYMNVKKEGPSLQGKGPVSLAVFPKDKAIKKVNFYHDDILVKTIHVVAVY